MCTHEDVESPLDAPICSIIIPTRDKLSFLQPCINSVLESIDSDSIEIIIVDNNSEEEETKLYLQSLARDPRINIISWDQDFNFSAINNFAVDHCNSDLLCFLNNDIEIVDKNWLAKLVPIATKAEVGAVGCTLLYLDSSIQHAGIALDEKSIAKHIAHGECSDFWENESITLPFVVDAVTAACLLVKKSLFQDLGGFNEEQLPVAYNDVDFCLRLTEKGFPVLLHPDVRLTHHETVSRQSDELPANRKRALQEYAFMQSRWRNKLAGKKYKSGIPPETATIVRQRPHHLVDSCNGVFPMSLSDSRRITEIIYCLNNGDWGYLATLLHGPSLRLSQDDQMLLGLMAGTVNATRFLAEISTENEITPGESVPGPTLVGLSGRSTPAALRLTEISRDTGLDTAVILLNAALVFDPELPSPLVALAWRLYENGKLNDALPLAKRAHEIKPSWEESSVALGWFLLETGDTDNAYLALHEALTLNPNHAAAHWYLGTLQYRLGHLLEAEVLLREAIHIDPLMDEARVTLAWLLHDCGRLGEALEHCRIAIDHGERPHFLILLGWLLAQLGDDKSAVGVFRRALQQDPADVSIRSKLVMVLSRCKRYNETKDVLLEGLALAPDNAELLLLLARTHWDLG